MIAFYALASKLSATLFLLALAVQPAFAGPHTFQLCMDEWPPYEYRVGNKTKGIAPATVTSILSQMGHDSLKITMTSWSRCLELVRTGECDGAFAALKTKDRQAYGLYPDEPLIISQWVFFIREDRSDTLSFRTLSDLEDRHVGVVRGFHYPPDLMDYVKKNAVLEYSPNSMINFRKLLDNRLDFVFEDYAVGMHCVRTCFAQTEIVPLVDTILSAEPLYIIFSKKTVTPNFVIRFSQKLRRFKQTKRYEELLRPYQP